MLIDGLSILLTALHLVLVNLALGGPVVCLWLQAREVWRGDHAAGVVGRRLLTDSMHALVVGSLLGVAALGLAWHSYPALTTAVARQMPTSRYWFGLAELFFSLACLGGYRWWWQRSMAYRGWGPVLAMWILALLGITNLAYHFPTLFAILAMLSTRAELWGQESSFLQLLAEPEALSRTVHFLLASLAVGGLRLSWRAAYGRDLGDEADRHRLVVLGARWALLPTLAQLAVGTVVLVYLPEPSREALLGTGLWASGTFALSLLASLGLMHKLAGMSLGEARRQDVARAALWLVLTIILMTAARHISRGPTLERLDLEAGLLAPSLSQREANRPFALSASQPMLSAVHETI